MNIIFSYIKVENGNFDAGNYKGAFCALRILLNIFFSELKQQIIQLHPLQVFQTFAIFLENCKKLYKEN